MDAVLAILLLLTAVGTIAYWLDFFLRGSVNVVEEEWYIRFERSFPVADGFMAASSAVAAVGLFADRTFGVAFALIAGSAMIFLGLMDVTFNIDNRLYRFLSTSWPMRSELFLNIWTLGLGTWLLIAMVGRV